MKLFIFVINVEMFMNKFDSFHSCFLKETYQFNNHVMNKLDNKKKTKSN